jgi:hypothetical protein
MIENNSIQYLTFIDVGEILKEVASIDLAA